MNTPALVQIIANEICNDLPDRILADFSSVVIRNPGRWDAPAIRLVQSCVSTQKEGLEAFIRFIAMEAAAATLAYVDESSEADKSGGVSLISTDTNQVLIDVHSKFYAECGDRGFN